MVSVLEVEKRIRSLEKVHLYEMNNIKTLARHHAMEFLKQQLDPILEGFKLEQKAVIREYYEMKRREIACSSRINKQTQIVKSQE